jgi:3'(2'), 5'-bisphosphate nucleotidase
VAEVEPTDLPALLALAETLARKAAAVVLAARARGIRVESKRDDTPVTEADRAAEAVILAGLRSATPAIPVIAEEEVAAGRDASPAPLCWFVDPLDGTREFAAGREEFAVNIGLVRQGRPLIGAVILPASGELFSGLVGRGAWKEDASGRRGDRGAARSRRGAGRLRLAPACGRSTNRRLRRGAPGIAARACGLGSEVLPRSRRYGRPLPPLRHHNGVGHGQRRRAIVEAAGGSVTTADGSPLAYGKPGFRNPDFLCRGRV